MCTKWDLQKLKNFKEKRRVWESLCFRNIAIRERCASWCLMHKSSGEPTSSLSRLSFCELCTNCEKHSNGIWRFQGNEASLWEFLCFRNRAIREEFRGGRAGGREAGVDSDRGAAHSRRRIIWLQSGPEKHLHHLHLHSAGAGSISLSAQQNSSTLQEILSFHLLSKIPLFLQLVSLFLFFSLSLSLSLSLPLQSRFLSLPLQDSSFFHLLFFSSLSLSLCIKGLCLSLSLHQDLFSFSPLHVSHNELSFSLLC